MASSPSLQDSIDAIVLQDESTPKWLVVGRGFSGSWWIKPSLDSPSPSTTTLLSKSLENTEPSIFYCDRFGGAFQASTQTESPKLPPPHLWMDFNNPSALHLIPSNTFDRIIVDWSTWRYLTPLAPTVLDHWRRILKVGGDLAFESSVASVRVVPDGTSTLLYDFDNPTHVVIDVSTALRFVKHSPAVSRSANPLHRLRSPDVSLLSRAVIIPAEKKEGGKSEGIGAVGMAKGIAEGVRGDVEGRLCGNVVVRGFPVAVTGGCGEVG
ncbi:hypothetical protein BC829DRAFT_401639 [Chytridium lagenaria]|nr:hypothetical protein BC829DRAFT_401639 [Chytridium lagenaria]